MPFHLYTGRHNDNADMDISGDSTPTSEASYSLSGTPTTHGGSGGGGGNGGSGSGGAQSSGESSIMPQGALGSALGNALPRLASHPNPSAVVTPMGAHYGAVSVGATGAGGGGGGPVSGATMLPTSGLASVPASIANSSNSLRNSVVGIIGSTSSVSFVLLSLSLYAFPLSTTRTTLADDCAHAGESGASSKFECAWTTWQQAAELQQGAIESDDAPEATFGSKRPRCAPSSYDGWRRQCQRSGPNGRRQWNVSRGWS